MNRIQASKTEEPPRRNFLKRWGLAALYITLGGGTGCGKIDANIPQKSKGKRKKTRIADLEAKEALMIAAIQARLEYESISAEEKKAKNSNGVYMTRRPLSIEAKRYLEIAKLYGIDVARLGALACSETAHGTRGEGAGMNNIGNTKTRRGGTGTKPLLDYPEIGISLEALAAWLLYRVQEYQKLYPGREPSFQEILTNESYEGLGFMSNQKNYRQQNPPQPSENPGEVVQPGRYMTAENGPSLVQGIVTRRHNDEITTPLTDTSHKKMTQEMRERGEQDKTKPTRFFMYQGDRLLRRELAEKVASNVNKRFGIMQPNIYIYGIPYPETDIPQGMPVVVHVTPQIGAGGWNDMITSP